MDAGLGHLADVMEPAAALAAVGAAAGDALDVTKMIDESANNVKRAKAFVSAARLVDGDMVIVLKVDHTGTLIPLACEPAIRDVMDRLTERDVAEIAKQRFHRSLGSHGHVENVRVAVKQGLRE
jgi:hypothetical protein